MFWVFIAICSGVFLASIVVSEVGRRRLRTGDRRAIWLAYLPRLILLTVPFVAMIPVIRQAPVIGIVSLAPFALLFVVWVRAIQRTSRSVRQGMTDDELSAAATETMVEPTLVWVGLLLVGGVVALIAILIVGLAPRLT